MLSDWLAFLRSWIIVTVIFLVAARGVAPFSSPVVEVQPDGAGARDACMLLESGVDGAVTGQRDGFDFVDRELAYAGSYTLCVRPLPAR